MGRALKAVEDTGTQVTGESGTQVADGEKPKRNRGPNKPPQTFLGGLRASVDAHRKRIASLVETRDKARAALDAANRELEAVEAPLRAAEELLARYPELPCMDGGSGGVPLPGHETEDTPELPESQPRTPPAEEPKQPDQPAPEQPQPDAG